jgi:hypothetical protein
VPPSPTAGSSGVLQGSWPITFEEQFKYRDESKMNAGAAQARERDEKSAKYKAFHTPAGFGLPSALRAR